MDKADQIKDFSDEHGVFIILANIKEQGCDIKYIKYVNTPYIKRLGGQYSLKCDDKNAQKWYRSDYAATSGLKKFIENYIINDKENN